MKTTHTPPTKGIYDVQKEYESRSGKPLRIYKAYPEIGRGGVDHDFPNHSEVEAMFDKSLRDSYFKRFLNFLRGWNLISYAN